MLFIFSLILAASLSKKAASHKKFIDFQNRRTLSHESDNYFGSSSSSEDLKTMTEVKHNKKKLFRIINSECNE